MLGFKCIYTSRLISPQVSQSISGTWLMSLKKKTEAQDLVIGEEDMTTTKTSHHPVSLRGLSHY